MLVGDGQGFGEQGVGLAAPPLLLDAALELAGGLVGAANEQRVVDEHEGEREQALGEEREPRVDAAVEPGVVAEDLAAVGVVVVAGVGEGEDVGLLLVFHGHLDGMEWNGRDYCCEFE